MPLLLFFKAKRPHMGAMMGDLFDMPVQVRGYTRADGTNVPPHTEVRKVRHDPEAEVHAKAAEKHAADPGKGYGEHVEAARKEVEKPGNTEDLARKKAVEPFKAELKSLGEVTIKPINQPQLRDGETLVDVAFLKIETSIPKREQSRFEFSPSTPMYRIGVARTPGGEFYSFAEYSSGFAYEGSTVSATFSKIPGDALDDLRQYKGMRAAMRSMWERNKRSGLAIGGESSANPPTIPESVVRNMDIMLRPLVDGARGLAESRKVQAGGGGRYAAEYAQPREQEWEAAKAKIAQSLASIKDPANRKAAQDYIDSKMPDLTLTAKEREWFSPGQDAGKSEEFPKRTEKRVVLIAKQGKYEFGIAGGAKHPSAPNVPPDPRDVGYTLKMRLEGKDWEPESYGWAPNAKDILDRVASGRSSAGMLSRDDIVHPELKTIHAKVEAERDAKEASEKAKKDKAEAERIRLAQNQEDIARHMAGVKRSRGKATIKLMGGHQTEVTGWQHGDFLAHKGIGKTGSGYTVTHVPSGASIKSGINSSEAARELAYRAHRTGAKWDGTDEGLTGKFRDTVTGAYNGWRDREPIPADPAPNPHIFPADGAPTKPKPLSHAQAKLADLSRQYHKHIPLGDVLDAARASGLDPVQEDGTPWSGFLTGADGRATIELVDRKTGKPSKRALSIQWHRMPSGNHELNAYIS